MAYGIGSNLAILCLVLLVSVFILRAKKVIDPSFKFGYFAIPLIVAAYGFAVPDSRGLDSLNVIVALLSLSYCAIRCAAGRALTLTESLGKVPAGIMAIPCAGPFLAFLADWSSLPKAKRINVSRGVLVGGIAAIPVLLLFGIVLAQADPMFARIFRFEIKGDPDIFFQRAVIFVGAMSFVSGLLVYFSPQMFARMNVAAGLAPDPSLPPRIPYAPPPLIGTTFAAPPTVGTTVEVPLSSANQVEVPIQPSRESEHVATFVTFFGLIAAMFLLFLLVQARYLFGGDSVVLQTENLTYAAYARKGFLEIVSVAGLCLPLLIFSQHALIGFDVKLRKSVNIVIMIVVALLFLLLASATYRLMLYVGAYGLSPLRVYVGAGMVWLFLLFAAYLRYGLKWTLDPIGRFVYASMVAITLGLNLTRPDYWIARVNLTRSEAKNLDPTMLIEAGADAIGPLREYSETGADSGGMFNKYLERQRSIPHGWKEGTVSQMFLTVK